MNNCSSKKHTKNFFHQLQAKINVKAKAYGFPGVAFAGLPTLFFCGFCQAAPVFINEFHYDNDGSDIDEGVEIAGSAGTSLGDWSLLFYNGSNGSVYKTEVLSGTIDDEGAGFGALHFLIPGLQNGPADAIALIDNNNQVVEFISYEGPLLAIDGAAGGLTSTDVGIEEAGDLVAGFSIQRVGTGLDSSDFTWSLNSASHNTLNSNQQISAVPLPAALPLFLTGLFGLNLFREKTG